MRPEKTTVRFAVMFGMIFLGCGVMRGQQPDTYQLTLGEALKIARKQNVDVMVSRLRSLKSKQNTAIARSALLPQVSLGMFTAITRFDRQSISGGDEVVALGPYQIVQGGARFSQVLFDMGAIRRLQGAEQAEVTAGSNQTTTVQTVEQEVIRQYLNIIRANADLERAAARKAIAERLETEAEHLLAAGVGTSIDTLRAKYQLDVEHQNVIDAEAAFKIAKQQLIELLELPPERDIAITPLTALPEVEAPQAADLQHALQARPEEAAARSEVERAELEKKAAFAEHLPTLQFSGFYDQQGRTWGGMIPAYTYRVTANLPIFTSGRIRAENKNAALEKQRAMETQRGVESAIAYQVVAARTHNDAARSALAVARRATALAHEELIQAEHRFTVGVANNIELVTAQQSLAAADASEVSSEYRYREATVDLYRALGRIEEIGAQP